MLASRSAAAGAPSEAEEGFAQLLRRDGSVLDSSGGAHGRVLTPAQLSAAAGGEQVLMERRVAGVEGTTRVLAQGEGAQVVAVGQSLQDRDDTLASLVASFAIGGPIAVVLASLLGYALTTAGLRPVEAMRRAEQVSSPTRTTGCRCPPPTTRSAGSARRSTRCSTACGARSGASAASSRTRAASCVRRWR